MGTQMRDMLTEQGLRAGGSDLSQLGEGPEGRATGAHPRGFLIKLHHLFSQTRVKKRTDLIGAFKLDPLYLKHGHQDSGTPGSLLSAMFWFCFHQSCISAGSQRGRFASTGTSSWEPLPRGEGC